MQTHPNQHPAWPHVWPAVGGSQEPLSDMVHLHFCYRIQNRYNSHFLKPMKLLFINTVSANDIENNFLLTVRLCEDIQGDFGCLFSHSERFQTHTSSGSHAVYTKVLWSHCKPLHLAQPLQFFYYRSGAQNLLSVYLVSAAPQLLSTAEQRRGSDSYSMRMDSVTWIIDSKKHGEREWKATVEVDQGLCVKTAGWSFQQMPLQREYQWLEDLRSHCGLKQCMCST